MPDDIAHLSADLHALRDLVDERDRRYTEGKEADKRAVDAAFAAAEKAVAAALAAAEKAVNAALAAQEKAAEKFEQALKEYKAVSNEWRATVEGLVSQLRELGAIRQQLIGMEEKISELRIQQQAMESAGRSRLDTKADTSLNIRWAIGVGLVILLAVVGWVVAIFRPFR